MGPAHIQFSCVHTPSLGLYRASTSSWKSSPHRSLPEEPEGWALLHLKAESLQPAADSQWHFSKEILLFQAELWFTWWIFSETIPCCSLLSAALPFSRDHTGIGQFTSSRVYSYIQFHAINEHLLLSQQNFIWPIFLFLCSPITLAHPCPAASAQFCY